MRREDFERLYEEHAQPLFGFLAYRTGDRPLAEDLLADTFERALKARNRFDRRKASEKTWLYAIALNLLRDSARRAKTEARALERMPEETSRSAEELAAGTQLVLDQTQQLDRLIVADVVETQFRAI